jgi:ABC-type transport system substrate-binding protein
VFSFARAKTELPWGLAGFIESIADVRAIDEHTVRIETKFPDPLLTLVKNTAITLPSGSSR